MVLELIHVLWAKVVCCRAGNKRNLGIKQVKPCLLNLDSILNDDPLEVFPCTSLGDQCVS
jgi:hypothetical protein